jgi:hypothetical protein
MLVMAETDNNQHTSIGVPLSSGFWLSRIRDIVNEPLPQPDKIPEPPVEVLPWLYLGPRKCLNDLSGLQNKYGITHVLSLNAMQPESVVQEL